MRKASILAMGLAAASMTPSLSRGEIPKFADKKGQADTAPITDVSQARWHDEQPFRILRGNQRNILVSSIAGSVAHLSLDCPPDYKAEVPNVAGAQVINSGVKDNSFTVSLPVSTDTTRRQVNWILCRDPGDKQVWLSAGILPREEGTPEPSDESIPEEPEGSPLAGVPARRAKPRSERSAGSTETARKPRSKSEKPVAGTREPIPEEHYSPPYDEEMPAKKVRGAHEAADSRTTPSDGAITTGAIPPGPKVSGRVGILGSAGADFSSANTQLDIGIYGGARIGQRKNPNALDLGLSYAERFDGVNAQGDVDPAVNVSSTIRGRELMARMGYVRRLAEAGKARVRFLLGAAIGWRQHGAKNLPEGKIGAENGMAARADTGVEVAFPIGKRAEIGVQALGIAGVNYSTSGAPNGGSVTSADGGGRIGIVGGF